MAEPVEMVGKVVGLEQKKYRDGRGPIPRIDRDGSATDRDELQEKRRRKGIA